jgi:hypothetical protein
MTGVRSVLQDRRQISAVHLITGFPRQKTLWVLGVTLLAAPKSKIQFSGVGGLAGLALVSRGVLADLSGASPCQTSP